MKIFGVVLVILSALGLLSVFYLQSNGHSEYSTDTAWVMLISGIVVLVTDHRLRKLETAQQVLAAATQQALESMRSRSVS